VKDMSSARQDLKYFCKMVVGTIIACIIIICLSYLYEKYVGYDYAPDVDGKHYGFTDKELMEGFNY